MTNIMSLPKPQESILVAASVDEYQPVNGLGMSEYDEGVLFGAAYSLEEKDLVEIEEERSVSYTLTEEGKRYEQNELPEIQLYQFLLENDSVSVQEIANALEFDDETAMIARTNFMRKQYGSIKDGTLVPDKSVSVDDDDEKAALSHLAEGKEHESLPAIVDRSLAEKTEETTVYVKLTQAGVDKAEKSHNTDNQVGKLTSEIITTGEWKDADIASYNVESSGQPYYGGRSHILRNVADRVKEILLSMGFQEMEGPNADADFWINDALFMPQDHPARTHWDRFTLDVPKYEGIDEELIRNVSRAHRTGLGKQSRGYQTSWSKHMAQKVALRGHTTSLTMRYLANGDIEPPARYFSVDKVYRNDTLDSTHLLEFYQIEGWVMADGVSVRDLMGTFEAFYEQFGITDIEFKPHYNPYTEPSFELFGRHPETGEMIEIGNSGIFREEVLQPLGVENDVMAWGLALERLVMLLYGFDDIRDLHGSASDIKLLRDTEVKYNANS